MVLDKALLLKGLAGVASVGGVAVGGYYISGSGKSEKKQVNQSSHSLGVSEKQEDELGIPTSCESEKRECDITEDQIKKIKFQALGDGKEEEITVNPESGIIVKLKIDGENDSKKYIFTNTSSSAVTIKRGVGEDKKVTLKGSGKTRFVKEGKKLKLLEPGDYGLPARCVTSNPCILTKDDLGMIKFSGFEDDGEATVEDFLSGQSITFRIEDNKYIFKNNNSINTIDIKKGSVTVSLDANGESEFTLESDKKLKKVELGDLGIPKACELGESGDSQTCQLSENDLKKIKFKDLGNNPNVTGLSGNQKINLNIQKVSDDDESSYPGGKKYIFSHNSSGEIKIINITNSTLHISLIKTEENIFKKENDFLVSVPKVVKEKITFDTNSLDEKINNLGLPAACTFAKKASGSKKSIECELSKDQIKALKFANKEGNEFTVSSIDGEDRNYKIKIEETANEENFKDKNIRVTFLNRDNDAWNKNLDISGSSDGEPLIIYKNSDTEFKINSSNKLEKAWKIDNLPALVGLKCPKDGESSGSECVLKENDGSIKVFIGNQSKDFKPTNKEDIENNISFKEDVDGLSQGIEFKVSNSTITGTNKDNSSESLELVVGSYEIRRINGNWRFAKKVN